MATISDPQGILNPEDTKYSKDRAHQVWARGLMRLYGISVEVYDGLYDAQGGVCAVCGGTNPGRRLCVDHDHRSGAVRGLLCVRCNVDLRVLDDEDRLQRLLEYLARSDI